jgi:lipopolysaccharide transport system ATP-binding protein
MSASVVFEGVWKKFRRGERHDSLRDLLPSLLSRLTGRRRPAGLAPSEFWALRDVSFRVGPGEALGIIGPNGAGKSTTLKLLTKILRPTQGRLSVKGRAGALIEVAAGFHPDLTGRENVFLQGAIMGMSQAEIARKFDAIVDFAGVEEFIGTPVKRYSSGMNARLGFAIAAHLDPDVLLVDEVLSVGDVGFQAKCIARMQALLKSGVPLVFVSHNLTAVVDLCTRAVLIDKGVVQFDGRPAEAVAEFRRYRPAPTVAADGSEAGKPIRITGVQLLHPAGESSPLFVTGRPITVRVSYQATTPIDHPQFAVDIHNADGVYCAGINTRMDERDLGCLTGGGYVDLVIPKLWLLPGAYSISVGILDASSVRTYDLHLRAYPFSVLSERRDYGIVYLEHDWRRVDVDETARDGRRHAATGRARGRAASGGLATTAQEIS